MAILPVLKVDDVVVGEGGGVATFTLRLSQPSASTVSVTVGTAGGTATASSNDYSPLVGVVVNFAPGETEKQVSVPITDDATSESPESLFLNLFSPQGLVLGRSTVTATIVDNDTVAPAPYVLIDDTVVSEGDGLARFTLRLNHATATALIVTYQTANGSAVAGSDYTALTSSVTFAPGETVKSVTVVVADDAVTEGDETFFLNLTGVTGGQGASLGNNQGMAIIARSDGPTADIPVLDVDDIVVGEGGGVASFTLRLSQPSASMYTAAPSRALSSSA